MWYVNFPASFRVTCVCGHSVILFFLASYLQCPYVSWETSLCYWFTYSHLISVNYPINIMLTWPNLWLFLTRRMDAFEISSNDDSNYERYTEPVLQLV